MYVYGIDSTSPLATALSGIEVITGYYALDYFLDIEDRTSPPAFTPDWMKLKYAANISNIPGFDIQLRALEERVRELMKHDSRIANFILMPQCYVTRSASEMRDWTPFSLWSSSLPFKVDNVKTRLSIDSVTINHKERTVRVDVRPQLVFPPPYSTAKFVSPYSQCQS